MDPTTRPRLSEIDIERIAYSAIGRHLRVMCVLCLLLLGLGFLLGHHVANLHAKKIAHEFERQSGGYAKQIVELGHEVDMLRQSQTVDRNLLTSLRQDAEKHVAVIESLRREIDSAEVLRSSLVASSLEQIEADRREALHELEACRSGDVPLKPEVVTQMMTRIVDGQMDRLHRLLGKTVPAACPSVADLASLPLVPVSEGGPSPTMAATPAPVAPASSVAPAAQEITFFPPIQAAPAALPEARSMPVSALAPVPAVPAPMPTTVPSSVRISDAVEVQPPAPPAPAPNPFPPASIATSAAPEPTALPAALPTPADSSAPPFAPAPPAPASGPKVPRASLFFAPSRKVESAAGPQAAPRLIAPSTASAPASTPSRLK